MTTCGSSSFDFLPWIGRIGIPSDYLGLVTEPRDVFGDQGAVLSGLRTRQVTLFPEIEAAMHSLVLCL